MWQPFLSLLDSNFISLFIFFWILRNLAETLFLVAVYQHKEYRFDRIRVHLTTREGKRLLLNPASIVKWLLLFSSLFFLFMQKYRLLFPYIALIFYICELTIFFRKKLKLAYKRPIFTGRAILLIGITVIMEVAAVLSFAYFGRFGSIDYGRASLSVLTLALDKSLPSLILLSNLFSLPLVTIQKKKKIFQAKRKIDKFRDLIVVGITGSYGKTSTKYFLAKILKGKYKVFYTRGSNNTDIGIAEAILKGLNKDHEIFIVEMGAYKRGEIKDICDIVKPKIGVITAIEDQHLALFGSRENILKTKFELLDNLPKDGLAILNGNIHMIVERTRRYKLKKIFYSLNRGFDIYARDFILGKKHIRFRVIADSEEEDFHVSVLGIHNVSNILAAVSVAKELKFTLFEISKNAKKIKPIESTMEPVRGICDAFLINDTFNANPKGVKAALEYLANTDWDRKILVMQPMIELGETSSKEHKRLGTLVGDICDKVYFTNQDYKEFIQEGYKRSKKKASLFWGKNRKEIAQELFDNISSKDVALFEGKEAAVVLNLLRKK